METEQQLEILKLLNRRLFAPFEVIANMIFNADEERTKKIVSQLENRNMIELVLNGRVAITAKGKAYVNKSHNYSPSNFYSLF